MVGFPGESEEQFQALLDFVTTTPLDHVGIFKFSPEKEAYAARLTGQVPESVKEERQQRLAQAQFLTVQRWLQRWVGRRVEAMVEGFHPDSPLLFRARHRGQCPELDGQIIINDGRCIDTLGKRYEVEITQVAGYDLVGSALYPLGICFLPFN
jgi:ribosomal protein S12 methylthiotransferase